MGSFMDLEEYVNYVVLVGQLRKRFASTGRILEHGRELSGQARRNNESPEKYGVVEGAED